MKVTPAQIRALRALAELCRTMPYYAAPRDVARALWPDSAGWNKRSNRGSTPAGGAMGATMPMKAAQLLWRLQKHRLTYLRIGSTAQWEVTPAGLRYLRELDGERS